ncbi:MAG: LptF/LptG family permease [Verrucomicrobiota bacterium]
MIGPVLTVLYRYIIWRILITTLIAIGVMTFVLVLGNAFQRVFDLLVNNDVPVGIISKMILLLIPAALTFTVPWGLLIAILLVFGRMSHDHELTAIRAAGIGLAPFSAPIILLSLVFCVISFFNNSYLAPDSMATFKRTLVDMGRENPTVFLRAEEPIDTFGNMRLYIKKKSGNRIEGVHIWELGKDGIPNRSIRADYGIIAANLPEKSLDITLYNARQEQRGNDPTVIDQIQTGMRASQLPIRVSLASLLDTSGVEKNITVWTLDQIGAEIISPEGDFRILPIITELQKRLAFSSACFTFCIIGIPVALLTQRRETSISFVISLGIVILYYLLVAFAKALEDDAGAYPELIIWAPNFIFQALGFWLLWKVNKYPY